MQMVPTALVWDSHRKVESTWEAWVPEKSSNFAESRVLGLEKQHCLKTATVTEIGVQA